MRALDIRNLDLAMLRTFDALMRERSVSRAAERLFLSQPAVSASLKRLRESFGDPLFKRSSHGVLPTARALELAPHVEAVLQQVQRLLHVDRDFEPAASDRILRVAGSDFTGRLLLPPLCRGLAVAGSRIRLFWETPDYSRMIERLRQGDLDLGLLPRMTALTGVESVPLYEDVYVAVTRHGHPALADGLSLDVFCAVPQVVLGTGRSVLDDRIDLILTRGGQQRHVQAALTSFTQIADLLAATDLIAVVPRRVAQHHRDRLATHPLPFELPSYRLNLCWDARANEDGAVQWLKDEMLRLVRGSAVMAA